MELAIELVFKNRSDWFTDRKNINELDLCPNFNLHYCNQPFIVKLDHFLGYTLKGICQKRDQLLIVQSDIMQNYAR